VRPGTDKAAGSVGVVYTSATGGTWTYSGKISASRKPGLRLIAVGGSDHGTVVSAGVPGGHVVAYQSVDGKSWQRSDIPDAGPSLAGPQSSAATLALSGLTVSGPAGPASGSAPSGAPAGGTSAGDANGGNVVAVGTANSTDSRQGFLAVIGSPAAPTSPAGTAPAGTAPAGSAPAGSARVNLAAIPGDTYPELAVSSIASHAGVDVAVGSANGHPAVWAASGGGAWSAATGATADVFGRPGLAGLSSITVGGSGWLAVGAPAVGEPSQPIVVYSPDGRIWRAADRARAFAVPGATLRAAASGNRGYVIVGDRSLHGRIIGAAWRSAALNSWTAATDAAKGALEGGAKGGGAKIGPVRMLAVSAGPFGYVAVGQDGSAAAVWMSPDGRTWRLVDLPAVSGANGTVGGTSGTPASRTSPGASPGSGAGTGTGTSAGTSAVLTHVTAWGNRIVAAGTVSGADGITALIAVSADGGVTWTQHRIPLPGGHGTVTGLASAATGFTAVAAAGAPGRLDVILLKSADGTLWRTVAPRGAGLSGAGVQEITALAAAGGRLLGAGFTATQTAESPTIWTAALAPSKT
jgi:hypothetical protein